MFLREKKSSDVNEASGEDRAAVHSPLEVCKVFLLSAEVVDSSDAVVIAIEGRENSRPEQQVQGDLWEVTIVILL